MAQVHTPHQVSGWTGWIGFAGIMMVLSGILHIVYGIGALFSYSWYFYASDSTIHMMSADAWGWTMMAIGALLILMASLLMRGNMFGRIVGALLVLAGAFANIALFNVAPIWASIAIIVNLFILYAIVAHGSEMKHMSDEM